MNRNILIAAAGAILALSAAAGYIAGWNLAVAALIGGFAGVALYHAAFGFTGAWRRFVRERRGRGLRAQLLLIGLACLFTFPLMAWGGGDRPARARIYPAHGPRERDRRGGVRRRHATGAAAALRARCSPSAAARPECSLR